MPNYPIPSFHFIVEWGGTRIGFSEVSGLNVETEVIEYREGSDKEYSVIKMPGRQKVGNVTMKRGIMKKDNEFFKWFQTIKMNQVERRDILIRLLDEKHEPVMIWRLKNAFPVKVESGPLKAEANEVAIETLEIAHEGLSMETQ